MAVLRSPAGCPWDREQTLQTLAPYVQEEAAEVVDAIERDDVEHLRDEVGDLLFEGVFLAQVTSEAGQFTAADALRAVSEKLIRRHPHVFAQSAPPGTSEAAIESPAQVVEQWDQIKAREKTGRGSTREGLLDGVPRSLPALAAALDIGRRVAKVGFDWPTAGEVLNKIEEEIHELRAELAPAAEGPDPARVADELGDLLFSVAQLARQLNADPEAALRAANRKFRRRFDALERDVRAGGQEVASLPPEDLEARWQDVKRRER